ncbi:hypothetical protein A0H81_02407 [Grifola frondosa]|uniref:Uncharacterized protein n=1 Tax=Grifola frondosa TaxID=5627 RepID=A0A1C7ML71_GRIFR|nr:hypothetical protein A0H81_02407 [Grifola frondosa]
MKHTTPKLTKTTGIDSRPAWKQNRNARKDIVFGHHRTLCWSCLSPMVAGLMSVAGVSWRSVFLWLTMFSGFCLLLTFFKLPETFVPVLLAQRASKLHKETEEDCYWAPLEKAEFIHGCLYLLSEAYPIVFLDDHLMNLGFYGLMFLPIIAGSITSALKHPAILNLRYEPKMAEFASHPNSNCTWAAPVFALSFWFSWTHPRHTRRRSRQVSPWGP